MRNLTLTLSLLGLVGCKKMPEAGIWALYLPADATVECEDSFTHNFTDAYVPEDTAIGGDWTTEETATTSGSLVFVQVEELGDGKALLLINRAAYPGTETETGWRFTWEGTEDSTETESHTSGYSYTSGVVGTSTTTIVLKVDGDVASGNTSSESTSTTSWTESDTWDPDQIGFFRGQIPSTSYLVYDDPDGKFEGVPQENGFEVTNCTGGSCSMEITSTCSGASPFTAEHVGYDDEDIYQYLSTAGQAPGI